jgi:hypothetical protein
MVLCVCVCVCVSCFIIMWSFHKVGMENPMISQYWLQQSRNLIQRIIDLEDSLLQLFTIKKNDVYPILFSNLKYQRRINLFYVQNRMIVRLNKWNERPYRVWIKRIDRPFWNEISFSFISNIWLHRFLQNLFVCEFL